MTNTMNDQKPTASDTPRTRLIMDAVKIAITADNSEQSHAYRDEAERQIEDLERELAKVTAEQNRLSEENAALRMEFDHYEKTGDRSPIEKKLAAQLAAALADREELLKLSREYYTATEITRESEDATELDYYNQIVARDALRTFFDAAKEPK